MFQSARKSWLSYLVLRYHCLYCAEIKFLYPQKACTVDWGSGPVIRLSIISWREFLLRWGSLSFWEAIVFLNHCWEVLFFIGIFKEATSWFSTSVSQHSFSFVNESVKSCLPRMNLFRKRPLSRFLGAFGEGGWDWMGTLSRSGQSALQVQKSISF